MKKRILCGLLSAALLACTMPAQAARTTVPVQIDGERLQAVSYLERGVTYVPMRTFLESLGDWSIWWDSGAGEAAAVSGSTSLRADPAADTVTIRGKTYTGKVWVENGRIDHAIEGFSIAGNILEMMMQLEAVGADRLTASERSCGSLLFSDLCAAGVDFDDEAAADE